jgi:hypothetical protein
MFSFVALVPGLGLKCFITVGKFTLDHAGFVVNP